MYGLFLCAGLFALLASRPQVHGAVWAVAIANKAALAVTTAASPRHTAGSRKPAQTVGWDGGLARPSSSPRTS